MEWWRSMWILCGFPTSALLMAGRGQMGMWELSLGVLRPSLVTPTSKNYINVQMIKDKTKVGATVPLTHRMLVHKGLQSRQGPIHSQIFVISHDRNTQQQHWLLGCSCDQSHGSAWGTSVMHHTLVIDCMN